MPAPKPASPSPEKHEARTDAFWGSGSSLASANAPNSVNSASAAQPEDTLPTVEEKLGQHLSPHQSSHSHHMHGTPCANLHQTQHQSQNQNQNENENQTESEKQHQNWNQNESLIFHSQNQNQQQMQHRAEEVMMGKEFSDESEREHSDSDVEYWEDALEDLRDAGFQYRTASFVKRAAMWGIGKLPLVGSMVTTFMNEEHSFQASPGVQTRLVRAEGRADVSNWFESHYFINKDGLAIFWRSWMPYDGREPRAIIILSHGLAEHSQRYEEIGSRLAGEGYALYAMDHQGHGCSEGDRMHVKWFADYVEDLQEFTRMAIACHPRDTRVFVLGHSIGGLIALYATHYAPSLYHGIILSAPTLQVEIPLLSDVVVPYVASFLPKLPYTVMDISTLCRDTSVIDRYVNDPLVCHGAPTMRTSNEIVAAVLRVPSFAASFSVPYLLMHGSGDKISPPRGSAAFHEAVKAVPEEDKEFHVFPGSFHELYNEPDRDERALACTLDWLEDRLSKLGCCS